MFIVIISQVSHVKPQALPPLPHLRHRLARAAQGALRNWCGAHDEAAGDGTGHEDQGEQNLVAMLVNGDNHGYSDGQEPGTSWVIMAR